MVTEKKVVKKVEKKVEEKFYISTKRKLKARLADGWEKVKDLTPETVLIKKIK